MLKRSIVLFGAWLFACLAYAQQNASISVELPGQEVAVGAPFEVKFTVENSRNGRFTPPDWDAAGLTLLGSSQSSSFSISNGAATSSAIYEYQLMASDTGTIEIPAAILKDGNTELRTEAKKLRILPGDGDFRPAPRQKSRTNPQSTPDDPKKKLKTIRM